MYIQITDRCNMTCGHCGFSCTAEGTNMTLATFRKALSWEDDCITIGGGEPTLHPKFWQIMGEAMGQGHVWLATNGSQTKTALTLAKLAKRGVIGCDLSQDQYHDPIEPEVVEAFSSNTPKFSRPEGDQDARSIRSVGGKEIKAGRSKIGTENCFCDELICKPNGDLMACGCADAPVIGNINDPDFEMPWEWEHASCYKEQDSVVLSELVKKHKAKIRRKKRAEKIKSMKRRARRTKK